METYLFVDKPPVQQLATLELHLGDCLADVHPAKSVAGAKLNENVLDAIFINSRRLRSNMLETVRFAEGLLYFP